MKGEMPMFRTVLVPLDGSELAERALPYAVSLAKPGRAKVVLVRVALPPAPVILDGATLEHDQAEAIDEAEQYVAGVAEKLRTVVPVETSVRYGRAAAGIIESINQDTPDAVVMATHGRTGLAHLLVGSVAEAVIADSSVPVFTIYAQPGELPAPPFDPTEARVVVPLDGSDFAEAALPTVVDLIGTGGELVLVTVVEPPQQLLPDEFGNVLAYLDQQEESLTREARGYLAGVQAKILEKYPRARISTEVRVGTAASGVIVAAADRVADLVVMASHGRTGVRRAVFGSVTGTVLREGSTPVLVVHPRATSQPTAARQPIDERMAIHF